MSSSFENWVNTYDGLPKQKSLDLCLYRGHEKMIQPNVLWSSRLMRALDKFMEANAEMIAASAM